MLKSLNNSAFIWRYLKVLLLLAAIGLVLVAPYTCLWLYKSGDVAVERAVRAQSSGTFAVFGSGVSQDFVDYKLQLYEAVKPDIAVIGSSRVMQFRGSSFRQSYVNVGGTAGNLPVLRSTLEAMLRVHKPRAVILGLDFWWFMPQWNSNPFEEVPPTSGSYNYGFESLKKPLAWLLNGKISPAELAPLWGGFSDTRFGIMAQQTDDGFGPDGSWYYTGEITGRRHPFDFQFHDTIRRVNHGIKAFFWAKTGQQAPAADHLDALSEIYCRIKARGIEVYVFIAPLSERVLTAMREREASYPHLFNLRNALLERGIDALDFTDPKVLGSGDCEFVDGFHGGEVTYVRILRAMAERWPSLLTYVNMERIDAVIRDWNGHALVYDERLTNLPEIDFMRWSCPKRNQ